MVTDNLGLLRLAAGSHEAGSGKGCAMNVESWINGDEQITDFPPCADHFLTLMVQWINDTYCSHRDGDLLCAPCSIDVLALARRTRGTSAVDMATALDAYVAIAKEEVLDIDKSAAKSVKSVKSGFVEPARMCAYAKSAKSARKSAAGFAKSAEFYAKSARKSAAGFAAKSAAKSAAGFAEYAAEFAGCAEYAGVRLRRAHHVIDRFYELTGLVEGTEDDSAILDSVLPKMYATT